MNSSRDKRVGYIILSLIIMIIFSVGGIAGSVVSNTTFYLVLFISFSLLAGILILLEYRHYLKLHEND